MSKNYMDSIYELLNEEEVEYNEQGIEFLDENPDDWYSLYYDESLAWADDITYLDDPDEEDEFDLDLGEGFIPLPQGNVQQYKPVVIDEDYVLDEFESDLVENYVKPSLYQEEEQNVSGFRSIYEFLDEEDEDAINIENAKSIINFPGVKTEEDELKSLNMDDESSALAISIAKEHLDNVKAGDVFGLKDDDDIEDDTSWVKDDKDLFGADISVIIAEDPNKEVVDEDFEEGSFEDWLEQQNK